MEGFRKHELQGSSWPDHASALGRVLLCLLSSFHFAVPKSGFRSTRSVRHMQNIWAFSVGCMPHIQSYHALPIQMSRPGWQVRSIFEHASITRFILNGLWPDQTSPVLTLFRLLFSWIRTIDYLHLIHLPKWLLCMNPTPLSRSYRLATACHQAIS